MTTDNEIPYGYCQCGCGQKTRISQGTVNRLNWKKGEPIRYILGHSNRKPVNGVVILCKRCNKNEKMTRMVFFDYIMPRGNSNFYY